MPSCVNQHHLLQLQLLSAGLRGFPLAPPLRSSSPHSRASVLCWLTSGSPITSRGCHLIAYEHKIVSVAAAMSVYGSDVVTLSVARQPARLYMLMSSMSYGWPTF